MAAITLAACATVATISMLVAFSHIQVSRDDLTKDAKSIVELEQAAKEQSAVLELLETTSEMTCENLRKNTLRIRMLSSTGFQNIECLRATRQNWLDYTQHILGLARGILGKLTGEDCSICIKLVGYDSRFKELPVLITMARDNASSARRREADRDNPIYPAQANTAFNTILSEPAAGGVFACDDLSAYPHYQNVNRNWSDHYNSTLVVAIGARHFRIRDNGQDEEKCEDVIGFFCVDSKRAKLDNQKCIAAAQLLAKFYNEYLNTMARLYFQQREHQLKLGKPNPDYEYRENRPLGLTVTATNVGAQRTNAILREAMVIYRMHTDWPGWDKVMVDAPLNA